MNSIMAAPYSSLIENFYCRKNEKIHLTFAVCPGRFDQPPVLFLFLFFQSLRIFEEKKTGKVLVAGRMKERPNPALRTTPMADQTEPFLIITESLRGISIAHTPGESASVSDQNLQIQKTGRHNLIRDAGGTFKGISGRTSTVTFEQLIARDLFPIPLDPFASLFRSRFGADGRQGK